MSSNEEVKIPLKYWVDDKRNRVIVAEASGDFVDVLFSFLSLPLGTIIRLLDTLDHVERVNTSEKQGPDNGSEQQEGRNNASEQLEGGVNGSEQLEARSEQQEGRQNTSEQQQRRDNTSKQQEGTGGINKLCQSFKDRLRLRNRSEQQARLGCINELYKSVHSLETDVFRNKICQKMLHSPRNPLESSCQRLKVKVDDSEPTQYFMCHNCAKKGSNLLVSSYCGVKCDCDSLMRKEIELLEETAGDDGVFVKGKAMFFIYDNLTVRRSSPSEFIKPGQKKLKEYKEDFLDREKILKILKQALTSKTPLSDVLLGNTTSKRSVSFSRVIGSIHSKHYLEIKVMVSKSKNKIEFVEADGDFVDFLASFLTTPLGYTLNLKNNKLSCWPIPLLASILKLRNGKLSLGSIRNLYKSVKNLDPSWFIESSNKSLLNPKVAPYFGCERNPLSNSSQDDTAKYWYGLGEMKNEKGRIICEKRMISKKQDMVQQPKDIKMLDPRSSDRKKSDGVGFMKRPCLFVVWDDLKLSPLTSTSLPISFSGSDNLLSTDLEEHLLKINKAKAINLLRASLTSDKGAFTRSLSCLLWKWRLQRFIPLWGWLRNKRNKKREKRKRQKSEKYIKLLNEKKEKEKKKQEISAAETKKKKEEINNNNSVQKPKEEVKA
ncbi:uncharacterized protein LOC106754870 isoform X1 [Vigna radiata var. radiata]|uniref:Uncharacterized protein LOC106754870 isoform X1 n=1 Tax=Vigna radiata var. radiata TaxID=3916 RepID=A0A1S3TF76_VIGRR|nr:uncharacterized protein LOC106754870 isoform X1 [Vigna radiata var. radiata]XP_022633811.1 uncharacterized protein LOC106754870 isoform X1 [Vigna radiata var. radiata]XP_022633812.1 uncharacterized protein LOC106754870 isoform X1 [Vigna radiata var. radiata]